MSSVADLDSKHAEGHHSSLKQPSSPPRRDTPTLSHAMEDVNVSHNRNGGLREKAISQGFAEENAHSPSASRSSGPPHSDHSHHRPSPPHPSSSTPGPTLFDRLEGSATEAWGSWMGNKQQEEAGRTLREYGRAGIEEAEKSGAGGTLG